MLLSSRHTLLLPYQFVSSQLAQNEPGTPSEGTQILVRSDLLPLTLMHAVGRQVSAVNPEQQIYNNVEERISVTNPTDNG